MAYDEGLEQRIQELLGHQSGVVAKKMFGGVGFMIQGNMACGVHKNTLIVRVGRDRYEEALAKPHASPFDITGRAMTGWVMVSADGFESDEALRGWVQRGVEFALSLPPK